MPTKTQSDLPNSVSDFNELKYALYGTKTLNHSVF